MREELDIDGLKARVDLVALATRDTKLQRRHLDYWGCCPLPDHSERTPSFRVLSQKQLFKCLGCGAGGDAITYMERTRGLSFKEAIEQLSHGVDPDEISRPDPYLHAKARGR